MLRIQHCVTANTIPKKKPYTCDICYKQFETPSKLARHYLIHTGQKPFECHVCCKTFRQLVHLERHQLTHNLPFKCIFCHRNFKNVITLLKHQQLHNENYQNCIKQEEKSVSSEQDRVTCGIFQCSVCWKSFTTEQRWMLHQCQKADHLHGTRRRKKTHICESCNKTFPSRSKLERHFLIHTGQKPFNCSSCGKSFRQSTHLKIHQLTHTEERPFQCCFCQKGFKIQSKLMKHKQLHARNRAVSNIYKGKSKYLRLQKLSERKMDSFENADTLELQENEPHDVYSIYVVPFQCPVCEQCFETEEVLNLHKCYLRDDKSSDCTTACSRTVSVKSKILMKLKCTGGKESDSSVTGREKMKSGHFRSPDLTAVTDQHSDKNVSTKTFKDCCSKLDLCKAVSWMKRSFGVPKHWQEHLEALKVGINLKGVLAGESMLSISDAVCNRDGAFYRSSDDGFFDNAKVLHYAFSAPPKNIHNRHKVCKCDRCEKVFPSSSKLQRHYLIHTGQKPFGCNVCGKTFRQSAHLKRHQLTHTEKNSCKSPVCQVEFENLNRFFNHQEDHIEFESSQPVGYSDYSQEPSQAPGFQDFKLTQSNQAAEIKVEIESEDFLLDTGRPNTEPYRCSKLLEAEQSCYSYRRDFSESVEKRQLYQCSLCFKTFKSPSKLERHYLMHAGQKPFECSVCGKNFRQSPHLKRHHLTHFKERLKLSSSQQQPENILFSLNLDAVL